MSLLVRFGLADDGTIYDCGKDVFDILGNLKYDIKILLSWFRINTLQAKPRKFQFMILGKKRQNSVKLKVHSTKIEESLKSSFTSYHTQLIKITNIFQTTRFNHTMIFFKLLD